MPIRIQLPTIDEDNADDLDDDLTWVLDGLHCIYKGLPLKYSETEYYTAVEEVCANNQEERLLRRLLALTDELIEGAVGFLADQPWEDENGGERLATTAKFWDEHRARVGMVRDVVVPLDRRYIIYTTYRSFEDICMESLKCSIAHPRGEQKISLYDVLSKELLEQCKVHRSTQGAVVENIQKCFDMLSATQLFKVSLQFGILEDITTFYAMLSDRIMAMNTLSIEEVTDRFMTSTSKESEFISRYVKPALKDRAQNHALKGMLCNNFDAYLSLGLRTLIQKGDLLTLKSVFTVCAIAGMTEELKLRWQVVVRAMISEILEAYTGDETRPSHAQQKSLIDDLKNAMKQQDKVVNECPQDKNLFQQIMKEEWHTLMNGACASTIVQCLARHCDALMRTPKKRDDNQELEHDVESFLAIFRHVAQKDLFESFYKRDLLRRLLHGRSASHFKEKHMISMLHKECGYQYTAKLQTAIRDFENSQALLEAFYGENSEISRDEFSVHVISHPLSTSPASELTSEILPPFVFRMQNLYSAFYESRHRGRLLKWDYALGPCTMRWNISKGGKVPEGGLSRYDLAVTQLQGAVLLMFNESETVTISRIMQFVKTDQKELVRQLAALHMDPKKRILEPTTADKSVESYSLNWEFTSRAAYVAVNQVVIKQKEEAEAIEERVEADRSYNIDANIVKVMKTHQSMTETELLNALSETLRFPVSSVAFQARLQLMLDKEFVERDETDPQLLKYVA